MRARLDGEGPPSACGAVDVGRDRSSIWMSGDAASAGVVDGGDMWESLSSCEWVRLSEGCTRGGGVGEIAPIGKPGGYPPAKCGPGEADKAA